MQDVKTTITYKGKNYDLVFNFNVMEKIQDEYGSLEEWGKLTDGSAGEPNAKAVKFGYSAMLNEGISIYNEDNDADLPFFTLSQVGRIISEMGLVNATATMNQTVIDSTQSTEKNG